MDHRRAGRGAQGVVAWEKAGSLLGQFEDSGENLKGASAQTDLEIKPRTGETSE